ncbi:hypothetical protein E2C01_009258 [Portunus trituberculatus]|uniref:Uncharacterized protein n=1 Tax=Portunus trituberculatus TaxID=210409 RepID=A0A5B7D5D6_PORTR|nr:hypothetical protein [Portunus trituberculatus]
MTTELLFSFRTAPNEVCPWGACTMSSQGAAGLFSAAGRHAGMEKLSRHGLETLTTLPLLLTMLTPDFA